MRPDGAIGTVMHSFSEFGRDVGYPNQIEYIRELVSYDALCPLSCPIERNERGMLVAPHQPVSPLHWSRQFEWPWALHHAELRSWHQVLDVGGGWSVFKYALAKRCHSVTSLEVDGEFINKTKESIRRLGFNNIHQVCGDVRTLPRHYTGTFDRVFCISVLEHVDGNHALAIEEMMQVLKPDGCLLLTFDIRIQGENKTDGNFYLDRQSAYDLCVKAGIPLPEDTEAAGAWVPNNEVGIVVLMARLCKK